MSLTRRFSPITLLFLSINGMVGSAWLFAPLYAAKIAGAGAIQAWWIGGLATTIIALTFAELSVLMPVAGGTARIPERSHGTIVSFVMSWMAWLSALTMAPIEVQAVLQYASTYFVSLTHLVNGVPVLTAWGFCVATCLMLAMCILNVASFKGLVGFNLILFIFKTAVIVLTIFALIHTRFIFQNFSETDSTRHWPAILSAVASGGVAFAFTGFKHGVELAGEAKRMEIAIPLAIVGSVLCCLLLYLGLQIAFIGVLTPDMLANGWSALHFSGDVGPFAGIAAGLGLGWLLKLLYIDAAVSPMGAGLVYVTSTARVLYAMSRIGFTPRILTYVNQQHFPVVAIAVNFVIGLFLFLPFPGWQAMVGFLVSGMVISYSIGPIALICLRLDMPNTPRPFRLPFAPVCCVLAFYCCNLMSYWTGWDTVSKLSIAMLIGAGFFLLACFKGRLPKQSLNMKSLCWVLPYLIGLVAISYLGAFGGKNIIPFGWDFLVMAIFSIVIFALAIATRMRRVE